MIAEQEIGLENKKSLPKGINLLLALFAGFWLVLFPFLITTMGFRGDFLAFYTAGHAVWWGNLAQLYDRTFFREAQLAWVGAFEGAYRFVYLPAFIGYYLPFTAFPMMAARILAVLTGVGLLGMALRISRTWLDLPFGSLIMGIMAFAGTYATFVVGQNSPLTLLLMTLITFWMVHQSHPVLAGTMAGFLLYKPQLLLGLGVVWLVRREWRSLLALGGMGVLWLVLSWLIVPTATMEYLSLGQSLLGALSNVEANSSLLAALSAILPAPIASVVALMVTLVILGSLAWLWARYPVGRWHYAMLWLSSLLSTPYVATYDLLLLLLPLSLITPLLPHRRVVQVAFALVWMGPAISLLASGSYAVTWAMLLLYIICGWQVIQEKHQPLEQSAMVSRFSSE